MSFVSLSNKIFNTVRPLVGKKLGLEISKPIYFSVNRCQFHTTVNNRGLEEFFEEEKLRGEKAIRVGREWRKDELRLKSNTDLHKLWYILLKERNMLLTMEAAHKEEFAAMPNPERIDKVEMSMENLEDVVRERNRAYWELEVGVSGERERTFRKDCFGRMVPYKPVEHCMPIWMNSSYRAKLRFQFQNSGRDDVLDFQRRLSERERWNERKQEMIHMRMAARVLRRFPDASLEAIKEKFPQVDVDRLIRWKKIIGETPTKRDL